MKEKYALKLEYEDGVTLCIWRCDAIENYTFITEYKVDLQSLTNLMYSKYRSLVSDNDWVYMSRRQVNFLLTKLGHKHIPEDCCQVCKDHIEGYVPFLRFYTGCSSCNPEDTGKYTYSEALKKSQENF